MGASWGSPGTEEESGRSLHPTGRQAARQRCGRSHPAATARCLAYHTHRSEDIPCLAHQRPPGASLTPAVVTPVPARVCRAYPEPGSGAGAVGATARMGGALDWIVVFALEIVTPLSHICHNWKRDDALE